MLMIRPPGAGKSMLAARLPSILPRRPNCSKPDAAGTG
jgi:predicted ATPase with chaperone activity